MSVWSHFTINFTKENFDYFFSLENFADISTRILIGLCVWASLWGLFPKDSEPNGFIFNVLLVIVSAHLLGKLMELFNLPALLGMLIAGFLLTNREIIGLPELVLNQELSKILRHIALVIVLLRAGLELDTKMLRKLTALCLRLSFIPTIVETATIALITYFLLDFPLEWGFLVGFLLSAVSPAVIVPPILNLKKKGLGMDKGIPSLLIASASIDDILAITGFGLCLKLIFSAGYDLMYILVKVPTEPLIGIMSGILIGLILWFFPSSDSSEPLKLSLLLFAGLAADFLFNSFRMIAAGPEACFLVSFVASLKWRYDKSFEKIEKDLKDFWLLFEPMLFGMIGTDVKISEMRDSTGVTLSFICLCVGLLMRIITTFFITFGVNFTFKEKVFIGFAWTPKATFQAAVAPLALELAQKYQKDIEQARQVMVMAFLSILFTAPLGAIAISILGPKVLNRMTKEERTRRRLRRRRLRDKTNV